jgi:hypothetical protein
VIGESDITYANGSISDDAVATAADTFSAASYRQTAGLTEVDGVLKANATINGGVIEGVGKTEALTIDSGATLAAGWVAAVPTPVGAPVEGTLTTGELTLESGATFQEDIGYPNKATY